MIDFSKKNITLVLLAVAAAGFVSKSLFFSSDVVQKTNSVENNVVKTKKIGFGSLSEQNIQLKKQRIYLQSSNRYKSTQDISPSNQKQLQIQPNIQQKEQEAQRQLAAKTAYKNKQNYKNQEQRAKKSREQYLATQKNMHNRNKNNPNMMKSKQVRREMAQQRYIQRQKQMQERMKMQAKIRQQNNS